MARQFVPDGEKIKCSFGKGTSNLIIDRPSTTIIFKRKWATETDCNIKPFASCTCPANIGKTCSPVLQKWIPDTVAQSVYNDGKRFLLSSSKTICTAYSGLVEIDLEDISPTEQHEDFAKKDSGENQDTDTDFKSSSNSSANNGTESKKNESITAFEKKYSNPRARKAAKLSEAREAREEELKNNFQDSTGEKIWDFVKDLGRHANPMELIPNLWHYGTGVVSQLWDDFKKSVDLLINIGASSADLAIYTAERNPLYLKALELTDDKLYVEQMAKNIKTDAELREWMNKQFTEFPEKFKSIPDNAGNWLDQKEDKILNAPTDQAMKEVGKSVVELIGFGKAVKAGRKVFTKDFWTGLNLKTTAKTYVANVLTAGLASKFPAVNKAFSIVNKAQKTGDYKKAAQEMKALAKAINEGKGPKLFHEEPPKEKPENKTNNSDSSSTQKSQNHTQTKANGKTVADPVDVITGTNIYDYVDFEISGTIPVYWKRIWYSDSKYMGDLGHGVHFNYDIHLEKRADDLLFTRADGRPAFFSLLNPEYKTEYNRKEKLQLTYIDSSTYQLLDYNTQLTYILIKYKGTYKLSRIIKDEHNSITFNYLDNNLNEIIDTAGRIIKIQRNPENKIVKITQHHRSKERILVRYEYNSVGDLIKITNAAGKSVILVYKNHLMVSKTHREGATCYWEYESYNTGAKCIHTWLEGGILDYKFEYHKEYNFVWDSYGNKTTYYHKNNIPVKIKDPLGGIMINEYNEFDELTKTIDQEGLITLYKYDTFGNQTSIRYPDGAEAEFAYNQEGRLLLQTLPEGGMISRYFKNNKLDTIVYPDQTMQTFVYNEYGLVSKITDSNENVVQLFYDKDHNLNHMVSPNGEESFWEYDGWGQCVKTINPEKHQQYFSYDTLGNVSTIKLPDKNTIELRYDSYGRILKAIDNNRIINYEYTPLGNLKSRVQDGRKVLFRYNREEQLIGVINEHKESYSFTRDALGNIIKEEGFDYITRKFTRDTTGKIIKEEKSNGKFSIYEYTKRGFISRVEYQDDSWATFDYNKDGLLTQAVNPNSIVKIERDIAGKIVSEDQDGYRIFFKYNDRGQQSKIESSLGASIDLTYTNLGEVASVKAKNQYNNVWKANFKYNSLGMETERSLPGDIKASWDYDHAGRHKQQVIKKQEFETRRRTYSWDVNHKLKKIVDNLSQGIVNFGYDDFDNLAWAQYEDKSYDYKLPDEVGNLYETKDKSDREYGRNGQLVISGNKTYIYDDEGNLIQKLSPGGVWKYHWAANGMLKSIYRPDRAIVEMEYDALGRRTAKIFKPNPYEKSENNLSMITRFVWNGNTPLHEWKYNVKDRPQTTINEANALARNIEEPTNNLITWIFDQGTFKPAAKITDGDTYSIITDHLGTPVEMYNSQGEKTWHAEYDIYGKIRTLVKGSLHACPFRYQGQYEDPEIDLYYNRFRYYNPEEGVYISQDPIRLAGTNPTMYAYAYDSNIWIDPFGLNNVSTGQGRDHVTYEVIKNGKPYVGYASASSSKGFTPDEIISYRYSGNFDDFGGIPPDPVYSGSGVQGKNIARGLEQQIHETNIKKYGKEGVANRNNPVGPNNPKIDSYNKAANDYKNNPKPS